jgi:hypothetical protein
MTIVILDIIHRPVFYLKLNSTLNILRLRYKPNRLMQSIGLLRRYINITITILVSIHRPGFYSIDDFSQTGTYLGEPDRLSPDRKMDNVQNYDSYDYRELDYYAVHTFHKLHIQQPIMKAKITDVSTFRQ